MAYLLCFSAGCQLCYASHRTVRCITSADRSTYWSMVVTVVGQASDAKVYRYYSIMVPPAITQISPGSGPTQVSASHQQTRGLSKAYYFILLILISVTIACAKRTGAAASVERRCLCARVCMYVCTYVRMYVCMYVCMCISVYFECAVKVCTLLFVQGGYMLTINGTNFKDRGTVTLYSAHSVISCATPPPGLPGDLAGPYWKPDGTLIKCLLPAGTGRDFGLVILARSVLGLMSQLTFSYDPPQLTSVAPVRRLYLGVPKFWTHRKYILRFL